MPLAKIHRIRKKNDFEIIFSQGKTVQNSFFFIYYLKTQIHERISRFAVVVSSKVSPKAVVRNKIRRRIREIIRKFLTRIDLGVDMIILVKSKVKDQKFVELESSLVEIFEKANVFKR